MSGPPGVGDTHVRHTALAHLDIRHPLNLLLQDLHFPRALHQDGGRPRSGAVHAKSGGVIASVLEPLETSEEDIEYLLPGFGSQVVQIGKYSTHLEFLLFSSSD